MIFPIKELLSHSQQFGYAVGAFTVCNLEGIKAVVKTAETLISPVILQIEANALRYGGEPLVSACLAAADEASVPVAIQALFASYSPAIETVLSNGVSSIVVTGACPDDQHRIDLIRDLVYKAHAKEIAIEGELSATGQGEGILDPVQAADFVAATGIDALTVSINGHERDKDGISPDLDQLRAIQLVIDVPLVLHSASGLSPQTITQAIQLGVCKLDVDTALRTAYVDAFHQIHPEDSLWVHLNGAVQAMSGVVSRHLTLFQSVGRAMLFGALAR